MLGAAAKDEKREREKNGEEGEGKADAYKEHRHDPSRRR